MNGLEEMLETLPKLLREREKALEEKERQLTLQRELFEKEHPNHGKPSDVIPLNVGGKRVDVLRRTLTQFEGSMLESKFSGRWDDSLEQDFYGNFFIDQPERLFLPLLDYLRAKQCETPLTRITSSPDDFQKKKDLVDFQRMVEYYGLTLAVYPMDLYRLDGDAQEKWKIVGEGLCEIESDSWATFCIRPKLNCHSRVVKSYGVVLGKCSAAQIGWLQTGKLPEYHKSETGRGVGYGEYSNGKSEALDSDVLSLNEGTIIRLEEWGERWCVDGIVVKEDGSSSRYYSPCLSIKGSCKICALEFEV